MVGSYIIRRLVCRFYSIFANKMPALSTTSEPVDASNSHHSNGQVKSKKQAEAENSAEASNTNQNWFQSIYAKLTGAEEAADPSEWPPRFCKGYECPKFTILERTKEYEVRRYDASNWVSTTMTGTNYRSGMNTLFGRLFRYITGANEKELKIAMTVPVLARIVRDKEGSDDSVSMTMSFFLPKEDNPRPTDVQVSLTRIPEGNMFVRSFPGYIMSSDRWGTELNTLVDAIGDANKYESGFYYTAGYDSPFNLFNRHNEIMLVAK
jgi:hypothetical protein